ncbi:MAG TPA: hypothetical protein PLU73_06040 [Bacteroidia bacterium]|nr:hypothetical protein [Bacteroidia bacterium]
MEITPLFARGVSQSTWQPGNLVVTTVVVSQTITTAYVVSGGNGPGCTVVLTLTQSASDCSVIE